MVAANNLETKIFLRERRQHSDSVAENNWNNGNTADTRAQNVGGLMSGGICPKDKPQRLFGLGALLVGVSDSPALPGLAVRSETSQSRRLPEVDSLTVTG